MDITQKLTENPKLKKKGIIIVNQNGELSDIVPSRIPQGTAGILAYALDNRDLWIDHIQNREADRVDSTYLDSYATNEAKKKGLQALFQAFEEISKSIGNVESWRIKTWILAARPSLMTNKDSFFYGWQPNWEQEHQEAAKRLQGIKLSGYDYNWNDLIKYHKILGEK